MDISELIGARLKSVRRKTARIKSARLKAVMELLPLRRIIFFFIRGPIHIPKLIHILKPKPKFVRTTKLTIIAYAQSFSYSYEEYIPKHAHTHTHTHIYIHTYIQCRSKFARICSRQVGLAHRDTASSPFRRGFQPSRLSAFNAVRPELARRLGNLLPWMPANAVQKPLAKLPVECKLW